MKVETYEAAKRRNASNEIDNFMELPLEVPSASVDGTVLDPVPGVLVGPSVVPSGEAAGEAALQELMGGV